jgi:hypothetical protein
MLTTIKRSAKMEQEKQENVHDHVQKFAEKTRETVQKIGREVIRQKTGIDLSQEQINKTTIPTQELLQNQQQQQQRQQQRR